MWAVKCVLGSVLLFPFVRGQAIPSSPQAPPGPGPQPTGQGSNPGIPGAVQPGVQGPSPPQAAAPFVPSNVPVTDADVCASSMPGQNGAPVGNTRPGIFSFFLPNGANPNNNPCVVQCRGYSGTWYAARPWGSPCSIGGEQRYCADNVCVTRNDTYMDYCKQNLQTSGSMIAVTPFMCSLECMDPSAGIILKVRMKDGTPCKANNGRGYSNGLCFSGGCSVMTPSFPSNIFSGLGLFG